MTLDTTVFVLVDTVGKSQHQFKFQYIEMIIGTETNSTNSGVTDGGAGVRTSPGKSNIKNDHRAHT